MARFLLYYCYKDLFEHGVLHNFTAEKYPQYLIWVMPAQGTLEKIYESFF